MKKGSAIIYPGTFDPITLGHIDVIKRGRKLFDKLIVAVAGSSAKGTLFTVEERIEMIRDAVGESQNLVVESFDGLLVDYVNKRGVNAVLRGLRAVSDFEYEFQMALINRKINEEVETIFLMTADRYSYISSRFIKEIARFGGSVDCFVPENVAKRLKEKHRR
ncbi:MAG: pantetheine-phosphate adenylyltransferase [Deltaproteobacteria bacterium]|nr:pantetheine-phosphate adenylyltransferase [Deltaproteobacteria bacterium]